jgi:hypothetical protein
MRTTPLEMSSSHWYVPEAGVLELQTYREHVRPVDDPSLLHPRHAEHKPCQTTLGVISARRDPADALAHLEDRYRHTLGKSLTPRLLLKADALPELRNGDEGADGEVGTH